MKQATRRTRAELQRLQGRRWDQAISNRRMPIWLQNALGGLFFAVGITLAHYALNYAETTTQERDNGIERTAND